MANRVIVFRVSAAHCETQRSSRQLVHILRACSVFAPRSMWNFQSSPLKCRQLHPLVSIAWMCFHWASSDRPLSAMTRRLRKSATRDASVLASASDMPRTEYSNAEGLLKHARQSPQIALTEGGLALMCSSQVSFSFAASLVQVRIGDSMDGSSLIALIRSQKNRIVVIACHLVICDEVIPQIRYVVYWTQIVYRFGIYSQHALDITRRNALIQINQNRGTPHAFPRRFLLRMSFFNCSRSAAVKNPLLSSNFVILNSVSIFRVLSFPSLNWKIGLVCILVRRRRIVYRKKSKTFYAKSIHVYTVTRTRDLRI